MEIEDILSFVDSPKAAMCTGASSLGVSQMVDTRLMANETTPWLCVREKLMAILFIHPVVSFVILTIVSLPL